VAASRVIRDPDGLGWVVEYGTGRTWRIVTPEEIGFEGRATREPREAEQAESAQRTYMGPPRYKDADPWGPFSPLGRANAVHVVASESLRLLRNWRG
jgi:hypothetical protein